MVDNTSMSSLMCSFNRGNVEGINLKILCLMFVFTVYVLFYVRDWFLCTDFTKGLYVSSFKINVHLLLTEFDCPEGTLCG